MNLHQLSTSILIIIDALKVTHAFSKYTVEETGCANCTCPDKSATHCFIPECSSFCKNGTLYNKLTNNCIRNTSIVCRIKPRNRRPRYAADLQCIRCLCGEPDTSCEFGPLCNCNNGLFYPKNNKENCASNLPQCGIFLDASPISKGCLTCKCDQGHDFCKYQNTTCNCMRGTVYRHEKYKECALQPEECIKMQDQSTPRPQEEEHCAPCQCDDKKSECAVGDTMCHCVNGSLRLRETGKCAMNKDDCGKLLVPPRIPKPQEEEHCAPCQCDDKQAVCFVVDTMCHCVNGSLRSWDTGKCATSKDDCSPLLVPPLIPTPQEKEYCAPCQCDDKQAECAVADTRCHCVNGRLQFLETGKCAMSKDDCDTLLVPPVIPTPQEKEHCAPCQCDDKQADCAVADTRCHCVNGSLRFRQTGKCATSKDDCGTLPVPPLIPTPQEKEHCAPCQCDDKEADCAVADTRCHCVNGHLEFLETGKCATSKDDCGTLLVPPLTPRPQEEHCAPCQCDDKQAECAVVGTMCNCVNERLQFRETGKCATNKEDCGSPLAPPLIPRPEKGEDHCLPCQCYDNQPVCPMAGSICDCVNERLRLRQTGQCAISKHECGSLYPPPRFQNPEGMCAACKCPGNLAECPVDGGWCDCINGFFLLRNSSRCVPKKEDCSTKPLKVIAQELGCAMCNCPEDIQACSVEGTNCDCVNRVYRYKKTGKCVRNSAHCRPFIRSS